ncbi:MAG: pilin [Bacteroidetes bacterium]|nr:pilin [Bacteroidota bacterium]
MIKKIINLVAILMGILILNGCEKIGKELDSSQPVIYKYVEKDTIMVGGDTVITGPLKDYESDSEVVYKLTVTSGKPLSKFTVSSSSDAVSMLSRIVKTEPAEAIDTNGNFTKNLNKVVIYYAYHIHPLVTPLSQVTVTFTLWDISNNASSDYAIFSVIKQGSTNGKLLNVINLPFAYYGSKGIGTQYALLLPDQGISQEWSNWYVSGPFFSFKHMVGINHVPEAIEHADDIDFAGYLTRYAGTNPVLVNNKFYLASPSDSVLLTTTYAGAVAASLQLNGSSGTANITLAGITKLATFAANITTTAAIFVTANSAAFKAAGLTLTQSAGKLTWTATKPGAGFEPVKITTVTGNLNGVNDVNLILRKNLIMRTTIREMAKKQLANGKQLRVVYFKRLDNIKGPNQVTPAGFDMLTHDNELDILLAGIVAEGNIRTGPMDLDQVYGFVMSDGKRGLLRVSPRTVILDGAVVVPVQVPEAPYAGNLFCIIKYQNPE